ncbi:MAG: nicotinate (nicotinamide) nucleotide adenylyltransferase [Spirochaetales bacterium]|nr:nicotinate (nicotinamide) nucleotide adenylyltransferase [Spirochaetales bacterium]
MHEKIETIIIGGTFNPIHIGHMHLAEEASRTFCAKRILIVPSFIPAHKDSKNILAPEHRIAMLEIACRNTNFEIETCEIERGGVSYSIDTIRYIRKKYNLNDRPGLLIGDDLSVGFSSWRNPDAIAAEAKIIIAFRDSSENNGFPYEYRRLENLMLNVSSSEIRQRMKDGRACRYLMPGGVYEYIVENKLYGEVNA